MFGNRQEDSSRLRAVDKAANPWLPPETFIDQGCKLVGELEFAGSVRIDGHVEGTIRAAERIIIGETAEIEGEVYAERVEIFGRVAGNLHIERATTLHQSARVDGEIHTAGIVVEEGALFSGTIRIGGTVSPAGVGVPGIPRDSEGATDVDDTDGPNGPNSTERVDGDASSEAEPKEAETAAARTREQAA